MVEFGHRLKAKLSSSMCVHLGFASLTPVEPLLWSDESFGDFSAQNRFDMFSLSIKVLTFLKSLQFLFINHKKVLSVIVSINAVN